MKNKKVKSLFCIMIAFALAIPGITIAYSNKAESVSALSLEETEPEESETPEESEESPDEVGQSEEQGTPEQSASTEDSTDSNEETPSETTSSENQSTDTDETIAVSEEANEEKTPSGPPTANEILTALKYTFRDAWNALVAWIKAFLHRS